MPPRLTCASIVAQKSARDKGHGQKESHPGDIVAQRFAKSFIFEKQFSIIVQSNKVYVHADAFPIGQGHVDALHGRYGDDENMDNQKWGDEDPRDDDIAQEFTAPGVVTELFENSSSSSSG